MVEFVTQNYSPEIFAFCQYLENIVYSETLLKAKFYETGSLRCRCRLEDSQSNTPFIISTEYSDERKEKRLVNNLQSVLEDMQQQITEGIGNNRIFHIFLKFADKSTQNETNEDSKAEFFPQKPYYNFAQMVLSDSLRTKIEEAMSLVENKDLIYNVWGFSEIDPCPKAVLDFHGKPGTGKTMCAHAIADSLGKKILIMNVAEIESKYVGEAPKNLQKAFETASKENCVLFFDEADSFLGKRISNVQQGAEQEINSLRSQMLTLLESHDGLVIFATNLVENYDQAFNSRILYHLEFELPNLEQRAEIIRKKIPSKLPLQQPFTNDDFLSLAALCENLGGREIKNAVLEGITAKAKTDKADAVFTLDDFKKAFTEFAERKKRLEDKQSGKKDFKIADALENAPKIKI